MLVYLPKGIIVYTIHRVPEILSLHPNWVPPLPPPEANVSPPHSGPRGQGGATFACGVGSWGGPIQTKGQTLSYSMYTIIPLRYLHNENKRIRRMREIKISAIGEGGE